MSSILESVGAITFLWIIYTASASAIRRLRKARRDRWVGCEGADARDAVLDAMGKAGIPTCCGPVSRKGSVVTVKVGIEAERLYDVDTSSPDALAESAKMVVGREKHFHLGKGEAR